MSYNTSILIEGAVEMNNLTPWFPISVAPVRNGVYELQPIDSSSYHYAMWLDGEWKLTTETPDEARHQTERSFAVYNGEIKSWRGFTSEQKA
jgi:hypothetical protein